MIHSMKKGLAVAAVFVLLICLLPATWLMASAEEVAENKADFDTIVTSNANGDSSYTKTYTTTNGWVVSNSAIQTGGATVMNPQFPVIGPDNTHKAVCLNGKVSAPGKVVSPTLTGGISKLTINYTKMFTDTKLGATITITEVATGTTYTQTLSKEAEKNDKYTVWTFEWVLEAPVTGEFTIEVLNNSPTQATGNKDRLTILELAWESVPTCQHTNTTLEGAAAATCTTEGHTGKTVCADCGTVVNEGEVIAALGHNEVVDAGKAATCTETGLTEGKHCDRCNEVLAAQEEIAALGHNEVVDAGKAATCTETGLTEGKHCDRCNEVLAAQEEIAALGHADADKDGLCDACGTQCGEPVPPTGDNALLLSVLSLMVLSAAAMVVTTKKFHA